MEQTKNNQRSTFENNGIDYTQPFDLNGFSKDFGFRIVRLFQYLNEEAKKKEKVMSKMLLISGASVGDFVRQKDFITAFNKASSSKYWMELLINGGYLSEAQTKTIMEDNVTLIRYLYGCNHPESRKMREESGKQLAQTAF